MGWGFSCKKIEENDFTENHSDFSESDTEIVIETIECTSKIERPYPLDPCIETSPHWYNDWIENYHNTSISVSRSSVFSRVSKRISKDYQSKKVILIDDNVNCLNENSEGSTIIFVESDDHDSAVVSGCCEVGSDNSENRKNEKIIVEQNEARRTLQIVE